MKITRHSQRQGDVLLVPIRAPKTNPPREMLAPRATDGSVVLALGETTGHRHRFAPSTQCDLYVDAATEVRMLHIQDPNADLLHEEHSTVSLGGGWWEIRLPREYTPTELRRVAD